MIEVSGLSKRYGSVQAVREVSFSVDTGQVVGLLGPNGAGKTTIMKILTCFHFPSAGDARIEGLSVSADPVAVKRLVGYLPENAPLYGDLTVDEYLTFAAEARGMDKANRGKRVEKVAGDCGLSGVRNKRIEQLSKGFRQRVGLAQAIVHDPSILILDEPTNGLDPNQILEIRELIRELGKSKTIILSTHILQEVEAVCSRVLILNEGRIAAQGTTAEIAASMKGEDAWDLVLRGRNADEVAELLPSLRGLSSSSGIDVLSGGALSLRVALRDEGGGSDGLDGGERIFDWAVANRLRILGMARKRISLEDIFVKLTEGEKK